MLYYRYPRPQRSRLSSTWCRKQHTTSTNRKETISLIPKIPTTQHEEACIKAEFARLGKHFNCIKYEDWYRVSQREVNRKFTNADVKRLAKLYGYLPLIQTAYPDHVWLPWKFRRVPDKWWDNMDNQRAFLNHFAQLRNINKMEDWYNVSAAELKANDGGHLLIIYESLAHMLQTVFPTHNWEPWKFKQPPRNIWSQDGMLKKAFDALAKELNISKMEDWYDVTNKQIERKLGYTVGFIFDHNPYKVLQTVYPHHTFHPWLFKHVEAGYYQDPKNLATVMNWIGNKLNFKEMSDWYQLSRQKLALIGATRVLDAFSNSPYQLVKKAFPHHNWHPWLFSSIPKKLWKQREYVRQYFDWLKSQLSLKQQEDWYTVTNETIKKNYGGSLLLEYRSNLYLALSDAYPEHVFIPWKFRVPHNYWKSPTNLRQALHWAEQELHIRSLDDWYDIPTKQLEKIGFDKVLCAYGDMVRMLAVAYPEHHWEIWKQTGVSKAHWKQVEHVRRYFDWLKSQLDFTTADQWYTLTTSDIITHGGSSLLPAFNNSVINALKFAYPNHSWDESKFLLPTSHPSRQQFLFILMKRLFPHKVIKERVRQLKLRNGMTLEYDLFVDGINLAAEYQGEQHYFDSMLYGIYQSQLENDATKAALTAMANIALVEVPFWAAPLTHRTLYAVTKRFI